MKINKKVKDVVEFVLNTFPIRKKWRVKILVHKYI